MCAPEIAYVNCGVSTQRKRANVESASYSVEYVIRAAAKSVACCLFVAASAARVEKW